MHVNIEIIKDRELEILEKNSILFQKLVAQIEKDFRLCGLELKPLTGQSNFSEFLAHLSACVNELVYNDYRSLANLFYRVDIAEAQWRAAAISTMENDGDNALCLLLIKRELQKVVRRIRFDSIK